MRRSGSIAAKLPARGKSLISSDSHSPDAPTYILRLNHKSAPVFPFDILEEIIAHYVESLKDSASKTAYASASTITNVLFRMILPLLGSSRSVRGIALRRFFRDLSLVSYSQDTTIMDTLGIYATEMASGYVR